MFSHSGTALHLLSEEVAVAAEGVSTVPRKKKAEIDAQKADGGKEKTPEQQYAADRTAHRKAASRHVLVLEADMDEDTKRKVFGEAERLRQAGNCLTGTLSRRLTFLLGRQDYKDLQAEYAKTCGQITALTRKDPESDDLPALLDEKRRIAGEMASAQEKCGVTWTAARKLMEDIAKERHLYSVYALSRAEDVWQGVESVLYGKGEQLSFRKKGELPDIRGKQIERGIPIRAADGQLCLSVSLAATRQTVQTEYDRRLEKMVAERGPENPIPQWETDSLKHELRCSLRQTYAFGLIIKKGDLFAKEETARITAFLQDPEAEKRAVAEWKKTGIPQDTFRPCYASLVCENIRGRLRVFCHITIEGRPCPKKKRDGTPRHQYGTGTAGVDLGPQCVEVVTPETAAAANLAERNGRSTFESEAKEKELLRAMDRSRRATNPQYYNEDGTIRRGKKHWKYSNRYRRLRQHHRDLCRKNAASRHYAINEMVNDFRELADEVHIEPDNVKAMQRRAKTKPADQTADQPAGAEPGTDAAPLSAEPTPSADTAPPAVTPPPPADAAPPAAKQPPSADAALRTDDSGGGKKPRGQKGGKKIRRRGTGRKKRFGRSILHRCPGYFFARLCQVFESTGGQFLVVDRMYRASQYDHKSNQYVKKKLSQRWHEFSDGSSVQRDLYSAFLLMCSKADLSAPDRDLCIRLFDDFVKHHDACLARIESSGAGICNFH